ncbi:hypothetical protein D3C78_1590270 [compost metagenome]
MVVTPGRFYPAPRTGVIAGSQDIGRNAQVGIRVEGIIKRRKQMAIPPQIDLGNTDIDTFERVFTDKLQQGLPSGFSGLKTITFARHIYCPGPRTLAIGKAPRAFCQGQGI